jgi:cytochrome c5
MRTTAARLFPILALFSLFFLTRCTGVVGEGGLPGDPISGDGGSGDNGGSAGATGLGGTIVTGSGGSSGSGTGGAGGGSVVASGLPCDVQALLQTRCVMCHASPPVNGAPMPLVNFANLIAASFVDPTKTFAQRALARIQQTAGQMPPAPNARATAAEISALGNWINAGYPSPGCGMNGTGGMTGAGGSGTGGSAGTGGMTGTGGRTGTGGTGGATGNGLPCDVQAVYQTHCTTCHAATPVNGAPMPLVTRANLMASSFADASMTFAQRTVVRMQSTTAPMPPAPGTRATATEVQTVNTWISAGYPAGTCGAGGAGGGAGGAGGGTVDPLGVTPRCTSGTTWTGGNEGSAVMNPGRACISCHAGEEEAPRFTIAGTLYPTGHEPNLCNGVNGTTGARVVIVDAANRTVTLTPNAAGNFTYTGAITPPYTAKVTDQGRERIMPVAQTSGDCNSCHTQTGANGAPGRITLP